MTDSSSSTEKPKNKGGHPGGPNRRTRVIAERLARDGGVTPLEVIMAAMRYHWKRAHIDRKTSRKISQKAALGEGGRDEPGLDPADLKDAAAYAAMAAPYIHPRLATHEVSGKGGGGIPLAVSGRIEVYLPDNGRRVGGK